MFLLIIWDIIYVSKLVYLLKYFQHHILAYPWIMISISLVP